MTTLALFLVTMIALSGTFLGDQSFTGEMIGRRLFQTEVFLIIISTIFLILVSVEEERKDAALTLEQNVQKLGIALERLNTQDQAKSTFLATLAHELRNPLATVVSSLELLRIQKHVAPDGASTIEIIERRIENIQRMLEDLLDISRIAEKKVKLKKRTLDIRETLMTSLQNIEHAAKQKQQTITTDIPKSPIYVHGDRTRLEQVFTNLLTNAKQYSNEGGTIMVSAVRGRQTVTVTVKDDGIGIDTEQLARIFEPFYQSKKHSSEQSSGLGIGLSVAKDLVGMHDGTITVESKGVGKGSTFIVRLPRLAERNVMATNDAQEHIPYENDPGIRRVLIVDDNKSAADGIAKLLSLSGFETECAYSGAEALEHLTDGRGFEAIFLDLALPDQSGHEVAKTLRTALGFTGRIITLSGFGQEDDRQASLDAGCNDHLTKPVRLAELLAALK